MDHTSEHPWGPEPRLTDNALRVLMHRYLTKGPDGQVLETPAQMFWRIARAVAGAEAAYGADAPASPITCPRCQEPLDDQIACARCPKCGYTLCS